MQSILSSVPWSRAVLFADPCTLLKSPLMHRFRDEAEQFQTDPVTAFSFAGMISTDR